MITDPLLARLLIVLYSLALVLLISPAAYRISRFVTTDVITERPRKWLASKLPGKLDYALTCNWCAGAYTTLALILVLDYFISIPFVAIVYLSTLTIVGLIGNAD